jgi:hypothetical protein
MPTFVALLAGFVEVTSGGIVSLAKLPLLLLLLLLPPVPHADSKAKKKKAIVNKFDSFFMRTPFCNFLQHRQNQLEFYYFNSLIV